MKNKLLSPVIAALASAALCLPAHAEDLIQIYQQARKNDAQFAQAQAVYQQAQELKPQARAGLLPNIGASAEYDRIHQKRDSSGLFPSGSETYNEKTWGVQLTQPIFRWANIKRLDQADAGLARAEANFAFAQQNLMLRTAQAYFDVLAKQDALGLTQAELKAVERQLEQTRQQYQVGSVAITSLKEAQARRDLVSARVIQAQNDVESAKEALREITGAYTGALASLAGPIPLSKPSPESLNAWQKAAEAGNLRLEAARYAAKSSMTNIGIQRAGHYPTLDLVGKYSHDDVGAGIQAGTTDTSVIGVQLNVPIFQGFGVNSKVREAQAQYTEAQAQLEQTHRATLRQASDAYRGVEASVLSVQAYKQAVDSNKTALEATQAGYQVGTRTIVDVLNAQQNLFEAERNYSQAQYSYLLNTLQLKLTSGRLSEEDLQKLNHYLSNQG